MDVTATTDAAAVAAVTTTDVDFVVAASALPAQVRAFSFISIKDIVDDVYAYVHRMHGSLHYPRPMSYLRYHR